MPLEQNEEHHLREVVDKYIDPTVGVQMTSKDYVVRPAPVEGTITVTLPPVAEAKGRFYTILNRGGGTVIVADRNDSEGWTADINLGRDEHVVLYSDGLAWFQFANTGAAVTAAPTTSAPTTGAPTTA